jgi:hypothetical protein
MQRRRLLHAMVQVAGEHGVQRASVGRVCERAHVSRRTFYDVFCDREACLVACPRMGELVSPLMGMIVLPYLGPSAARARYASTAIGHPELRIIDGR